MRNRQFGRATQCTLQSSEVFEATGFITLESSGVILVVDEDYTQTQMMHPAGGPITIRWGETEQSDPG